MLAVELLSVTREALALTSSCCNPQPSPLLLLNALHLLALSRCAVSLAYLASPCLSHLLHCVVVTLLSSHIGEPGLIPGRVTSGFSYGGISRFICPFIPVLLHTHLNHPHRLSRTRLTAPFPPRVNSSHTRHQDGDAGSGNMLASRPPTTANRTFLASTAKITYQTGVRRCIVNCTTRRRTDKMSDGNRRAIPTYEGTCHPPMLLSSFSLGATVAERLACSPPTKAIRAQSPAGSLRIFSSENRAGRSVGWWVFSGISRFPCPFILTPITLIGSQDLDGFCPRDWCIAALGSEFGERVNPDLRGGGSCRAVLKLGVSGAAIGPLVKQKWNTLHGRNVERANAQKRRGRGGLVVRLLASHQGEPGSIPGGVAPRLSQVGIVPDDAAGQRVSSGISQLSRPLIPALRHIYLTSPSSALKT
ncbi:hypothetical protein PR048_008978 [Dryococelus australis]|uniref:Uncharacterized protein n=1 Tax=Dryococelus australis TaxID=614101 RepID=A0ABQ9HZI2_9NEOP|nr:hypothetical protein PR048_008978 [Dryococelus australis]